jgi:hypothetical protein
MGKFVKKKIEALKEKKRAVQSAFKLKTMMKGKMGLYTFYSIWFATIKAYIAGEPSKVKRLAWKIYVVPFIPGDWTCTDKGYEGVKAKRRCKLIQHRLNKENVVNDKDKVWLKEELLPAFEEDFRKKNLDFEKLGGMDDEKININIKKLKSEKKYKEMLGK